MIILLSDKQREHFNLLHQHSSQVMVDFCKLAIDYLNNGSNETKCSIAAEKLDVSLSSVQNVVLALGYLIVEACKHNLTEQDFKSSLAIVGFSSEKKEVLLKLYNTKRTELSSALCFLQQNDHTYQDFTWRFEVQLASRHSEEEIKPIISMDFILMTPKSYEQCEYDDKINHSDMVNGMQIVSPFHIKSSIRDSKAASHCQNIINHVLLHCDLTNLINLTNKLDQALKESKSQHVRKVQRSL